MPRMLITLSIGPVQSLIEAARRTRDLWGGSWLLSELSRAAARTLHNAQPGSLIFPCPADPDRDLQPLPEPGDEANIANILRAEVELPDAEAARTLCEQAKAAARERLIVIGKEAQDRLSIDLRAEVWTA
ncbi:MAG: type III-B CRISPR-associated protein Cas10/Cmr2, partial [Chromatiaceae bacterium]|nr:type III-B CRISPR-associated protein Cas10/Cmr2 [Chromatiaceae bacterium]